jgi:HK97 family phage portal protein
MHPLYRLLHDAPNPEMTSFVFRETLMAHLLLWGNAYAQIIRDGAGRIIALYPLMPSKMDVNRDAEGHLFYAYSKGAGDKAILRSDQVLHIPGLGFDGIIGYSPIAMAKNAVGISLATEDYGAEFFANGAFPGGTLESTGKINNPEELRKQMKEKFGGRNRHSVAVLENGLKFQPISIPPNQAQFLETRKFQLNEIARIFRVPPHLLGDLEKATFSNIEQQSLEFVKFTLAPWVARWEQSLCRSLLTEREQINLFIRFNLDGLMRGDYKTRMEGYAIARQNGFMSANDIRELEDMNRISDADGGNLYLINGNMMRLSDAGAAYRKGGDSQ